jgi:hypothetical protein
MINKFPMKINFFHVTTAGFLTLALVACNSSQPTENTEAVEVVESTGFEIFGDENITPEGVMEADAMLAMLEDEDSVQVKIRGTITECCQKKGCWMNLELENGKTMLVRFKDYEFFVPMDAAGRKTIIEGLAKRQVLDVDWLRHQAEDAGKSAEEIAAINEPQTRLTFMATGVIIE